MLRIFISISFLLLSLHLYGQSISRQVIGSTGKIGDSNSSITATVGSSIISTSDGDEIIFTQGFQQPTNEGAIELSVTAVNPDCYDIDAGFIDLTPTGCSGEFEILWSTGDTTAVIENLLPGTYVYTITSGSCSLTDSVELSLLTDCGDEIPNLVTPNSDGVNDFLEIPLFHLEANQINEVVIFNQWGQQIWKASNYDNSFVTWTGINAGGDPLPAGTYYYLVTKEDNLFTGFIELLR